MNGADSYLYFEMQITGDTGAPTSSGGTGQNFYLDSSAQSIIQRLRIEGPDGAELERIEEYNVLHSALLDFQVGGVERPI